jgi:hypothetical protein
MLTPLSGYIIYSSAAPHGHPVTNISTIKNQKRLCSGGTLSSLLHLVYTTTTTFFTFLRLSAEFYYLLFYVMGRHGYVFGIHGASGLLGTTSEAICFIAGAEISLSFLRTGAIRVPMTNSSYGEQHTFPPSRDPRKRGKTEKGKSSGWFILVSHSGHDLWNLRRRENTLGKLATGVF